MQCHTDPGSQLRLPDKQLDRSTSVVAGSPWRERRCAGTAKEVTIPAAHLSSSPGPLRGEGRAALQRLDAVLKAGQRQTHKRRLQRGL